MEIFTGLSLQPRPCPLGSISTNNQVTTPHGTKQSILPIQITMANRTAQMKGGQSYLDSPKGAGQKKKATQGESKVSTRKPIYLFPQQKKINIFLHFSLLSVPRVFHHTKPRHMFLNRSFISFCVDSSLYCVVPNHSIKNNTLKHSF